MFVNDIVELQNDFIEVIESYIVVNQIICFLKCDTGKLDAGTILRDDTNKEWIIKRYVTVFGSFATYEKIQEQEQKNIFQYQLQGNSHNEKPLEGSRLKFVKPYA